VPGAGISFTNGSSTNNYGVGTAVNEVSISGAIDAKYVGFEATILANNISTGTIGSSIDTKAIVVDNNSGSPLNISSTQVSGTGWSYLNNAGLILSATGSIDEGLLSNFPTFAGTSNNWRYCQAAALIAALVAFHQSVRWLPEPYCRCCLLRDCSQYRHYRDGNWA